MSNGPSSASGPEPGGSPATGGTDYETEIARLREERDAAVAAADRAGRSRRRRAMLRRVTVGVLVVLFAIVLPLTITMTWAHRTVLNTDTYVKTVTPIAQDPAVVESVSRQATDQLYAALDPEPRIAEALPPKAAFLAGPISGRVKGFLHDSIQKVLTSPQFQQFWVEANRAAHTQLVAVLRGDSKVVSTTNGQVVLNLVPLLNSALKNVQGFVSDVVGKPVTLPTISGDELPAAACEKLATALDRPVPPTCGQIALFPADKLTNAQRVVKAFDRAVVVLLVATPLLFIGALWLSRRKRRTLLQLAVGGALGLVVFRRATMWLQSQLVAAATPENKAARTAVLDQVLHGFFTATAWFLVGALVLVVAALLAGPYRWAVATRRGVRDGARWTGHTVAVGFSAAVSGVSAGVSGAAAGVGGATARAKDEQTLAWIRAHLDVLRAAGVVVAVLLLLVFDVNFFWFLVIAALLAVYELWLERLRPKRAEEAGAPGAGPAAAAPGPGQPPEPERPEAAVGVPPQQEHRESPAEADRRHGR